MLKAFLVEARKQIVAGQQFRGASEACAKGAEILPPKSLAAVPLWRLGGLVNTGSLSSE